MRPVRRTSSRWLARILIHEVVIDVDDQSNEAVVTVHCAGERHTQLRVARTLVGHYPDSPHPAPVEVMRQLGGLWPNRQLAVTMNRMRCTSADAKSWTALRLPALRERPGAYP